MPWFPYPPLSFRGNTDLQGRKGPFDVILLSADAYVDHPSFPAAVIVRLLESWGFSVAVITQPDWTALDDFCVFGEPNLFFGVSGGAMDSMVANFTAAKMPRHTDRLSPGGKVGLRPKRAVQVYTQRLREAFPRVPVVIGGVEASLRRFSHYDFWSDRIHDPMLLNVGAEVLFYGLAESAFKAVVEHFVRVSGRGLERGRGCEDGDGRGQGRGQGRGRGVTPPLGLPQTCIKLPPGEGVRQFAAQSVVLPAVEQCRQHPEALLELSRLLDTGIHPNGPIFVQPSNKADIVCFPPAQTDWDAEGDLLSAQKYNRRAHPLYRESIPALLPVQFSLHSHRGCAGTCTFCSIALHQGRAIRSRSPAALLAEARTFVQHPDFRGTIVDVGGPSVNMYAWSCATGGCSTRLCTHPVRCPHLVGGLEPLASLLGKIAEIPGIKHVFLGSGLRYDLIQEADWPALREIIRNHVSGQLKVAPEHVDKQILELMRKGGDVDFAAFVRRFQAETNNLGIPRFLVPYFILAFPGSTGKDEAVANLVRRLHLAHEQVQEFTPTPGTLATAMYAASCDLSGLPLLTPKTNAARSVGRRQVQGKSRTEPVKSSPVKSPVKSPSAKSPSAKSPPAKSPSDITKKVTKVKNPKIGR